MRWRCCRLHVEVVRKEADGREKGERMCVCGPKFFGGEKRMRRTERRPLYNNETDYYCENSILVFCSCMCSSSPSFEKGGNILQLLPSSSFSLTALLLYLLYSVLTPADAATVRRIPCRQTLSGSFSSSLLTERREEREHSVSKLLPECCNTRYSSHLFRKNSTHCPLVFFASSSRIYIFRSHPSSPPPTTSSL